MLNALPIFIISTLWLGSVFTSVLPYVLLHPETDAQKIMCLVVAPVIFGVTFMFLAGVLSRVAHRGIIKGVFPRQKFHPIYFLRRIYGLCWTQVFYFKPLYSVLLAVPVLKACLLKLFGYKGSTNFVVYPDTWIRDLPLLNIGENAYLSNRATIGTNICLSDGNIMVDSVTLGSKSLVGHLAMIAPCLVGNNTEIGVGAALGIRVKLGNYVKIGPKAGVGHGTRVGDNSEVGQQSHIGIKVIIGEGIKIPVGANIPNGSILNTQTDMDNFYSAETVVLTEIKNKLHLEVIDELEDVS